MNIQRPEYLLKNCIIKPFDDLEGLIVAVKHDRCGSEILVRYILYGAMRMDWFYDFDIELKEPTKKGMAMLQELENVKLKEIN